MSTSTRASRVIETQVDNPSTHDMENVSDDSHLSDINILCHLVCKTSVEAREIRNFALAWKSLKDPYDNTRLLMHNQLQILFSLPVLEAETSSGVNLIQRGINGCLSTMSIYDVNIDNWDTFLVFICLQRFPKLTTTFVYNVPIKIIDCTSALVSKICRFRKGLRLSNAIVYV